MRISEFLNLLQLYIYIYIYIYAKMSSLATTKLCMHQENERRSVHTLTRLTAGVGGLETLDEFNKRGVRISWG